MFILGSFLFIAGTVGWLIETIVFLFIEGWHWKATNSVEIMLDRVFGLSITIGMYIVFWTAILLMVRMVQEIDGYDKLLKRLNPLLDEIVKNYDGIKLGDAIDRDIGKKGTSERDEFDKEVKKGIEDESNLNIPIIRRSFWCKIGIHKLKYIEIYGYTAKVKCCRENCNAEFIEGF